jgi:hypothetical protein
MSNLYQFKGIAGMKQPLELTILGRAGKKVLQKLSKRYFMSQRKLWLFVDFAEMNVPLHSQFDILLKGDNKTLIPSFYRVTVLECLDQFGNQLTAIPEGYKTICRLEFHPRVPAVIDELPSLDTWKSNPSHITLANLAELQLAFADPFVNDLSSLAYFTVLEQMTAKKPVQSVSDFYSLLEKKFKMDKSQADRVLGVFMQMGKIKRTVDNDIELVPAV